MTVKQKKKFTFYHSKSQTEKKSNRSGIWHLQMGERMMTQPIGYRKNVVLSKKGNTVAEIDQYYIHYEEVVQEQAELSNH